MCFFEGTALQVLRWDIPVDAWHPLSRSLWLKFFGSRYQKPGTKDTEVSSDISVDSTVGLGIVLSVVPF